MQVVGLFFGGTKKSRFTTYQYTLDEYEKICYNRRSEKIYIRGIIMVVEIILTILEIIGTIAFAVSGAFVAIKVRFDIFGVVVIGCITAVGGGMIRDVLIGNVPPTIFSRWYIVAIACVTSIVVFCCSYKKRKQFDEIREKIEHINNIFDAIGLAAFTVMGTELAFTNKIEQYTFLSITLGVLTGVGGGLLRDVLTETLPYIFKKHIYAVAAIFGAILYYLLRLWVDDTIFPSIVAMICIITIRLLSAKYHLRLPKIEIDENKD